MSKFISQGTMPFAEERNAAFAKLAARAAQANMTPAERAAYEESRKNLWDYYNTIDTAVDERVKQVVSNMYAEGLDVLLISKCTGLNEEEVMKIIQTIS